MKKRKLIDRSWYAFTIIINCFLFGCLLWIFIFVCSNGFSKLSFEFLFGKNSQEVLWVQIEQSETPFTLQSRSDNEFCSNEFGFCISEIKNESGIVKDVVLTQLSLASPLREPFLSKDGVTISDQKTTVELQYHINAFKYTAENGKKMYAGFAYQVNAEQSLEKISSSSTIFVQYKTRGGGIKSSMIATIQLVFLSLLFSLPIGVGTAIYLAEYAGRNKITNLIRSSIDTLSGFPSIIFGLAGATIFFKMFKGLTGNVEQYSTFSGAATMAIILLPIIIRTSEEAITSIPSYLKEGSFALGATKTQTVFKIVLPNATQGILTASLLGIGRIVGESAALMSVMSLIINDQYQLIGNNTASTTLATHMYTVMAGESPDFQTACAIAIIILGLVFILNISLKILTNHWDKKKRG